MCCVLIDEIHMFDAKDIERLSAVLNLLNIGDLFISLLPGSWSCQPLPNSASVISHANNITVVQGICGVCHRCTQRSVRKSGHGAQIQVGKALFEPQCYACAGGHPNPVFKE